MSVNKYELQHAIKYATEADKFYMLLKYIREMPEAIRDAAQYILRFAESDKDYYVPAFPLKHLEVVERTWFDQKGCEDVACFPFLEQLVPCGSSDPPQEVRLGSRKTMACQLACEKSTFDTEYRDSKCFVANIHKKQLAMAPEKIYGMKSKHNFHTGLDVVDGHLQLNAKYCEAYGLDFRDGDCYESTAQTIAEIFIGSNVFRLLKRGSLQPKIPYKHRNIHIFPRRIRRNVLVQPPLEINDDDDVKQLALDLAKELAVEIGVDVSLDFVAHVLRKKVPGLVIKAVVDLPIKSALLQAVAKSYATAISAGIKAVGTAVKVANVALAGYGLFSLILDLFDPYDFNKVLTKKRLQDIDRGLDEMYFERSDGFEIEMTPEFLWNHSSEEEDESERFIFFSERVREYLDALAQGPPTEIISKPPPLAKETVRPRNPSIIHTIGILVIVVLSFVFSNYIHYWAVTMFAFLMITNNVIM